MSKPDAIIKSVAAANPTLGAFKAAGCALTSHSGLGLYEITLDQPLNSAECTCDATVEEAGGVVTSDADAFIEHVSDTVKRVHTNLQGVADDTVSWSASFYRIPAGH